MISFILPTHDRPEVLARTLNRLGELDEDALPHGCEIIVVDNASSAPVRVDGTLRNGIAAQTIRRTTNEAAAGRNVAAERAGNPWLFMLDDDSYPLRSDFAVVLQDVEDDVAAVGAEILLPNGRHEDGGLPEVFIGCGVAIRRDAFLEAGGYDPAFHYYVEEYDLAAKLILRGWRIVHDFRLRVRHEKNQAGRDMNLILQRLVRNNAWIAHRYAPQSVREGEIARIIERYANVAVREHSAAGFARGMDELASTLTSQLQCEMSITQFDRFCGLAAVRRTLAADQVDWQAMRVHIIDEGKNAWVVRRAIEESGSEIVESDDDADVQVIGTISPGPMIDALVRRRRSWNRPVIAPWKPQHALEPDTRHDSTAAAYHHAPSPHLTS